MYGTRIVIVDADAAFRRCLKEAFRHSDYLVAGEASDARGALQAIFKCDPQLVVLDPFIPGSEGIGITGIIDEHRVAPVVAIVSGKQRDIGEYVRMPGVYGVLLKPLQEEYIHPVMETALANFERFLGLEKELKELRREVEGRKIVEKAKSLLMERQNISEQEAYKYFQKLSMDRCVPLARIARDFIKECRSMPIKSAHKD